jgi:hypothetical protein
MPDPSRMFPTMDTPAPEDTGVYSSHRAPERRPEPQDRAAARMYPSVAEPAPQRRQATPEGTMYPSMKEDASDQHRAFHGEQKHAPTAGLDASEFDGLELPEGAVDTLMDLRIDRRGVERLQDLQVQHSSQYWDRQLSAWQDEIMSEPNADRMVQDALVMVQAYGDKDLPSQLGAYGNHPGLIRMLSRIRRQLQQQ